MRARRLGIVLAVLLVTAGLPPALAIAPDPSTGRVGALPVVAAVLAVGFALATYLLAVPAWRGRRRPAIAIGVLQLVGILQALPLFVVAAELVPPGAVITTAVAALLAVTAFALVTYESSPALVVVASLAAAVAGYAGLVAIGSAIVPDDADRLVQTASAVLVAVGYAPLLRLMRRTIGRALDGGRVDPAGTAIRLGRRIGRGDDVVEEAVAEIRAALLLTRLEIVSAGEVLAAAGEAPQASTAVDLPIDEERELRLRVTLRPWQRHLHRDDRAALALVAVPLGLLVREASLLAQVRDLRAQAAHVRESERASVHRDLHDGVGPLLAGATFRADAARALLREREPEVGEHLDIVRAELRSAITEVRRVVDGLRPVELEQRGIWAAVRRRADAIGAAVELPEGLALPEATELVLYRVVGEALANAERHAPGRPVRLSVRDCESELQVRLENELATKPAPDGTARTGVGLGSLRARAEEVGGTLEAGLQGETWVVLARLPLR